MTGLRRYGGLVHHAKHLHETYGSRTAFGVSDEAFHGAQLQRNRPFYSVLFLMTEDTADSCILCWIANWCTCAVRFNDRDILRIQLGRLQDRLEER